MAKKSGSKDPTKGFIYWEISMTWIDLKKRSNIWTIHKWNRIYNRCFCDFDSNPIFIIPRIRISTRSHVSENRLSVYDKNIISDVKKLLKNLNSWFSKYAMYQDEKIKITGQI